MEYVEMFKDPDIALGFYGIVTITEGGILLKKTIRMLTSAYHHTLCLLSLGEFEEELLMKSWSSVNGTVDKLLETAKVCDDQGVIIHIVRFLEASMTVHLSNDFSKFPVVFETGKDLIKKGMKTLKDLVTTPFIGGSVFNVVVRTLISIASLKSKLREPIIELLKKQIVSLPPTLYDHHIISLYKTIQKNLFCILRTKDKVEFRRKLSKMENKIAISRKNISPWLRPLKRKLIDKALRIAVTHNITSPWDIPVLETRNGTETEEFNDFLSDNESSSPPASKKRIVDSSNILRLESNTQETPVDSQVQEN
ncbi:UNVERIFIED_CONTAM: hypothetical protein RMT77_016238 [Armadillidium vulgare]